MATNIDERIVAAKFDASDFEKGVNKTIKKLDELKKSLDVKQTTKDVKELAEKTEASTDSISKSVDKLSNRLTTFVGMVKQQILSGLAEEVSSVFLNLERSITGFIRSISSDQVSAGMAKYEQMLTSVRVMMSAGKGEEESYKAIERLQEYSDETSYSLTQMTDAMSKMVAAGVNLETATKNVEGIANACANAGINATDASRAFFNLSQAYSSGALKYTDYRSLELLNMTTQEFKQAMLESAEAAGTLKKVGDGVWQTINKNDKKVQAGKKVTEKNLSEMLKYNFMNTNAMNQLFGSTYWMEVIGREELEKTKKEFQKLYGDNWEVELKKKYGNLAVTAFEAAKEARSFTDVINALKDAVSSGWSTTFQHLFGKLSQAKEFFTDLSNGALADVIYTIGEYRNALLGYWNELDATGTGTGGVLFRQTILNIADALGTLFHTFQQILPGFDELGEEESTGQRTLQSIGETMKRTTGRIRDFSIKIKEAAEEFNKYMNSPIFNGEGKTRIEVIRTTLANIGNVISIVARIAKIAIEGMFKAFEVLQPVIDGVLKVLEKVTEPLSTIDRHSKVYKDLEHTINNILTILEPIANILGQIIGFGAEVVGFFAQMALDTVTSNLGFFADALGLVLELFTHNSSQMEKGEGVLDGIRKDFEGIKEACQAGLSAVGSFFTALFGDLKKLFGLTEDAEKDTEGDNGIFSGIIHFFDTNEFVQSAKAWIDQALIDIGDYIKSIPGKIKEFGANIYSIIRGMIFEEKTQYNGSMLETKTVLTPFGEWLDGLIKDVKGFVLSIPQKIIDGVGTVANWIDTIFNSFLGEGVAKSAEKKDAKDAGTDEKLAQFDTFVASVVQSIKGWFNDLPAKIEQAIGNIGNFFTLLWSKIDTLLFGRKVQSVEFYKDSTGKQRARVVTKRIKTGFSKWFDGIIQEISKFITNIPEYIKAGIKGAGDIISSIIKAIFGREDNKEVTKDDVQEELEKPFLGIDLTKILDAIKDIGMTIINQIARIFTGTDDVDSNVNWFSDKIAEGIEWIRTKAETALKWVLDFLVNLPDTIVSFFTGEAKAEPGKGPIGTAILNFGEAVGTFISVTLPAKILEFVDSAVNALGKIWDKLYKGLTGESDELPKIEKPMKKMADNLVEAGTDTATGGKIASPFETFVENIGKTISNIWQKLPVWIAQGIELAIIGIDNVISMAGDWIGSLLEKKGEPQIEKVAQKASSDTIQAMTDTATGGEKKNEPALLTAIKNIGSRITALFTTTIPGFIQDAWKTISGLGSEIWNGFTSIFSGETPDSEIGKAVKTFGTSVKTFLTDKEKGLPKFISDAWTAISGFVTEVWDGFKSLFTGETPKGQVSEAVASFGLIVKNFFTNEENGLPKYIKEAWTSISGFFSDVWSGILAAFTGEIPESERAKAVKNIINGVKNLFITAFKGIKDFFAGNGGSKNETTFIKPVHNKVYSFFESTIAPTMADKEAAKDIINGPSFSSFTSGIVDTFVSAFEAIGPTIVNGIAGAFDFLSKLGTIIVGILSGDKSVADIVTDLFGKEKPEIREAFLKIGESLKNFFIDVLPQVIGSAIGWITAHASDWFSKLFGAMNSAKAKAEDDLERERAQNNPEGELTEDDVVKSATGVLDMVKSVIDSLTIGVGVDLAATLATIIAIIALLKALKNLFSIGDELDAAAGMLKWGAILVVAAGLTTFLSSMIDLIKTGDEAQINKVFDMLDKIGAILEKLAWIAGIITAGKLVEAVGNSKWVTGSGGSGGGGTSFLDKLGGAVSGFVSMIGIGGGVAVGSQLAAAGIETAISSIANTFMDFTMSMSNILTLFDPLIDRLVGLDDRLTKATSAIEGIRKLFVAFYDTFAGLYSEASGIPVLIKKGSTNPDDYIGQNDIKTSAENYMDDLEKGVGMYYQIALFLEKFGKAVDEFPNISKIKLKVKNLTEFIGEEDPDKNTFVQFLGALFNALDTAFTQNYFNPMGFENWNSSKFYLGMSTGLEILSNALSIFGSSLAGLDETHVNAFKSTLDVFENFAKALSETHAGDYGFMMKLTTGDNSLSAIGNEISLFGQYVKSFINSILNLPGFDTDAMVKDTRAKIDAVLEIAKGFGMAANYSFAGNVNNLSEIAGSLPDIGTGLGEFISHFNRSLVYFNTDKEIDTDRIRAMGEIVTSISELLVPLQTWSQDYSLESVVDFLNKGITGQNGIEFAASLRGLLQNLTEAFEDEEALKELDPVGPVIAKKLFDSIQTAFDDDKTLRPTITPVLNLEGAKQQLIDFFGLGTLEDFNFSEIARAAVGANNLQDEERIKATELYPKLASIQTAIENGPTNAASVSDLTTAFTNVKVVVDKETLVGEIVDSLDSKLGDLVWNIMNNISNGPGA